MKISKTLEFDAGHRLMNDSGPCSNIHGHRYKLEVTLQGDFNPTGHGTVVNFRDIKQVINDYIIVDFDHSLILNPDDRPLIDFCIERQWKTVFMPTEWKEPTAENMVTYFADILRSAIGPEIGTDIRLKKLVLWETPTCSATLEEDEIYPPSD